MTKAPRKPRKPKVIAPEWRGFASRLKFAVGTRRSESDLSQNDLAAAAGIDSGQMTKILSGERALGVQANTVVLLARSLRVSVSWLMTGEEPSGLQPAPTGQVEPPSVTPTPGRVASR